MANNKKKNQKRNSNITNNYKHSNNNKYNRYQKQVDKYDDIDLSVTKQQQLIFDDIDLDATVNLDTSFIEARGKNRKKVVEKTLENNRKEFENLQKEEKKVKTNSSLYLVIILLFCLCVGLIGFDVYYFTNVNANKTKKEIIYKEQKVVEEVVDENILFLGDSLTYRYDLDKYYKKYNVVNSGIGNDKTSDILKNMKSRVYDYNPSKVFLLIGANDLCYDVSSDEVVKNIEKIIKLIKKNRPYAKIYLESIYPINKSDDDKIAAYVRTFSVSNDDIKEVNKKLEDFAKKENITYIDIFSELVNNDGNLDLKYTKEGLHMTDEGYDKITDILLKYIKEND